jgi:hypothetical protein
MIAVVPTHHALEDLKHVLDRYWVIEHRECTIAQRVGKHSGALCRIDLAWAHDDGRRRLVEALEKLKNARAGWNGSGAGLGAGGVHRDREVDDRNVHTRGANDIRSLVAALRAIALNADSIQNDRELVGKRVFAPTAVGQQQIEATVWGRAQAIKRVFT